MEHGKDTLATYYTKMSPQTLDELRVQILNSFAVEKKYRQKGYTSQQLADDLGTNLRYISAAVNMKFGTNFASLINKYRVEEAVTLLSDRHYAQLNLDEIGSMVGFSNRQSFYAAFSKMMGCTPREFRLQRGLTKTQLTQKKPAKRGRKKGTKKK